MEILNSANPVFKEVNRTASLLPSGASIPPVKVACPSVRSQLPISPLLVCAVPDLSPSYIE